MGGAVVIVCTSSRELAAVRESGLLPSARQRASILGSWAVADKATALGLARVGRCRLGPVPWVLMVLARAW